MITIKPKPEGSRWTDEQWQAISARGNNILVAAAAGSGKTAVLVERIIQKITDPHHPVDVDRLLVVTFTNAAAAEMRQRIGQALEKALAQTPDSPHLRRQLSLLNKAEISTLHAFCLSVVKKYYYQLKLDPQFRLANELEAELIKEEVLEELLEEEYAREDNEAFIALVEGYTSDRGDVQLAQLIDRVYEFSRSHPDPKRWLEEMAAHYEQVQTLPLEDLPWSRYWLRAIKGRLAGFCSLLQQAIQWCKSPGGPEGYLSTLEGELSRLEKLAQFSDWAELHEGIKGLEWVKLPPAKGDVDPHLKEKVQGLRDEVKKGLNELMEQFASSPSEQAEDMAAQAPLVRTLIRLVHRFGEKYWAAKQARGLVDFNDLEHLALAVLREKDQPSAVALAFREQFEEILVDEYQDTNLVQEAILSLISRGNNLFMVGDVKQSIYRFRLAEPQLFLSRYKAFTPTGEGAGLRINLARNFRSRKEVLEGVNYLFFQLMDEEVGEMAYDDQAALRVGAAYPPSASPEVDVLVINKGDPVEKEDEEQRENGEQEEEELETAQLEARLIARKIKELLAQPYQVLDKEKKVLRPVTYRDMVILMRSMPWASVMMEELREAGIPVYAELSTGYFEAVEVSTMLSLLKVIDNPDQDIPLAAVLRSPIVGLKERELARVRLEQKEESFYAACTFAARTLADTPLGEKLKAFLEKLNGWREKARQGELSELIWQILRETGYYDFVGGLPGGKQRQANLRALYDRARSYESTSFRGLYRFLRFIERLQDRGDDLGSARALSEQENVVRLLTIHKSKGLEFPVVFVAGLGKAFNTRDLNSPVLLHKELGFGLAFVDHHARLTYPTWPQLAIKEKLKGEMLAEELRILYVALTRAKEKLILVGTVKDGTKALSRWQKACFHGEWLLPAYDRLKANSYLDWIGPAIVRHQKGRDWLAQHGFSPQQQGGDPFSEVTDHPSAWHMELVERSHLQGSDGPAQEEKDLLWQAVQKTEPVTVETGYKRRIAQQLSWEYPHYAATRHRSKLAATEVKRLWQADDGEGEPLFSTFSSLAERPSFIQGEKVLSPVERGTAMHLVMQHVSLKGEVDWSRLENLVEQLVERELLTPHQREKIDVEAILTFLNSPLGCRLRQAPFVQREVPFSLGLSAREVYRYVDQAGQGRRSEGGAASGPHDFHADEVVLVQGVIDCLFRDEEGLVLIDYKTDTIKGRFPGGFEEAKHTLLKRYQTQLYLYGRAVEEIWQERPKELYLYFFDGGHILPVPYGKGGEEDAHPAHR